MTYLLTHGTVVTMNAGREIIEDGAVAIDGRNIVAVGSTDDVEKAFPEVEKALDCHGQLILPGFIDAHSHAGHCMNKALAYDCSTFWMPIMTKLYHEFTKPEYWYLEGRLAALERLKGGVTCSVSAMSNSQRCDDPRLCVEHARGYAELGMREVVAVGPSNPPFPRHYRQYRHGTWEDVELDFDQQMEKTEESISLVNHSHGDLIRAYVAPFVLISSVNGSSPTVPDEAIKPTEQDQKMMTAVRNVARRQKTRIHTEAFGGMIRLAAMCDDPLLGDDVHIQHCRGISFDEAQILAETGTHVTSAPGVGQLFHRCPIPELLGLGVNVCITTDGTSPAVSFDMLQATRKTRMLQCGALHDQFYLPLGKLLEMITIDAAKAIGRDDDLGSLEVGKRADVITINMRQPHLAPNFMPVHKLMIYGTAQDVDTTIVDGKILMRGRQVLTCDEEEVIASAERESFETIHRAGYEKYLEPCDTFWGNSRCYNFEPRFDGKATR